MRVSAAGFAAKDLTKQRLFSSMITRVTPHPEGMKAQKPLQLRSSWPDLVKACLKSVM